MASNTFDDGCFLELIIREQEIEGYLRLCGMKQLIKLGSIVLAEGISDGLKSFQMCFFLFELRLSLLDELFGADSILLPESVLRIFLHYSKNNNIQSLYSAE